jgi:hypothetical protein
MLATLLDARRGLSARYDVLREYLADPHYPFNVVRKSGNHMPLGWRAIRFRRTASRWIEAACA